MEDVSIKRKGEVEKSISLDGVTVNLLTTAEFLESMTVEMPPGSVLPSEYEHEGEEIRMVLEGEVEIEVDGKSYLLKEGDIMWHKSTKPHKVRNPRDKKAVYFFVNFPPSIEI